MICRIACMFWAVAMVVGWAGPAEADEPVLKNEVARLFELGWEPSLKAHDAARDQAFKLAAMEPAEPRLAYAYALVQIRQRKYPDADRLVNRFLAKEQNDLHAWRTKIWLSLLQRQYDKALLGMDRASQLMAADAPSPGAAVGSDLHRDTARFLGRAAGFLAGPAQDQGGPPDLAAHEEKFLARLDENLREAFHDGRDSVTAKYAELTGEGTRTKEEALADAEIKKQEVQAALAEQEQRIAAEREEVEPVREKLDSEFKAALADLENQARPLVQQLARIESQAAVVNQRALQLAGDIDELRRLANRTKEPRERERLNREADRLAIYYRRYEVELAGLNREAGVINAQRQQLVLQQQQAQVRYQQEMKRLADRVEGLEAERKRIAAEERRLSKPVSGNTPRVRELARVANALTTYEQLPLEQERQRLLDTFD